jgi:hypothetical protein
VSLHATDTGCTPDEIVADVSSLLDAGIPDMADAPTGSAAFCLTGGNILHLDGDPGDYVHPGTETLSTGDWSASVDPYGNPDTVHVNLVDFPTFWNTAFSSEATGAPLAVQLYDDAERWPFESDGHPGLEVFGDGRGCNTLSGRFEILDLVVDGASLLSFTATFEQHCETGSAALEGCVHYEE